MQYSKKIESGILFLSLEGNLMGEIKGPELIGVISDVITDGITLCAIDISKVEYINSSGIGVLITILTKFRNKGGEVCIINPSDHVRKLLIITKLTAIFNITDTAEEAVEKLKSAE